MTSFMVGADGRMKNVDGSDFITRGDLIVSPSNLEVFKVLKVNPRNYLCVDEKGGQWNIRRTPRVKLAPAGTVFNTPEKPKLDRLVLGQVVTFKEIATQRKFGAGKFVVTKSLADDRYQVAALNGDGGRFVRCGRESLVISSAV